MKKILLILIGLNIASSMVNVVRGDMSMAMLCITAVAVCIFAYRYSNTNTRKETMDRNNKAIREALADLLDGISEDCKGVPCEKVQRAKAALSAPPRNCDVGTAEGQYARHEAYCERQDMCCINDKIFNCRICFTKWAQRPYEKEGKEQPNEQLDRPR